MYDGVVHPDYLRRFLQTAQLTRAHFVVLLPPTAVCLERVGSRSGHGFTDPEATARMHAEFTSAKEARLKVIEEPYFGVEDVVRATLERFDRGKLVVEA